MKRERKREKERKIKRERGGGDNRMVKGKVESHHKEGYYSRAKLFYNHFPPFTEFLKNFVYRNWEYLEKLLYCR